MDQLNFTFKKTRGFGDLIQDFISLFKIIFKHLNARIFSVVLPFMAVFILIAYYLTTVFSDLMRAPGDFGSIASMAFIPVILILFVVLFIILISTFGIEYMFLLEERRDMNFTSGDIFKRIKQNSGKYVRFFLSSLVIGLILLVPLYALSVVLKMIPFLGSLILGIISACIMLYFYCALFLYIQGRGGLAESYRASFHLVKAKILEYGLASYVFQLMIQVITFFIILIPAFIFGIIAFTTVGFSNQFLDGFMGKFLVSVGSSFFMLIVIFFTIYMILFYVLQYLSLLESSYKEDTFEQIEQIGGTADEF